MSSNSRGHGSRGCAALRVALLSAGSLLAASAVSAADLSGGVVAAGTVQIGTQDAAGQTLITQTTQKAVINWADFSVAAGNSVRFAQPGTSSVTLNRVTGGNVSKIDGGLSANGQLWVLNPNGVLIGAAGRVSAAGFLATTRSISDSDFMAGQYGLSGGGDGAIGNAGTISVNGGYAVLAGKQVSNSGLIEANLGQIALGAGQGFTVDLSGDKLLSFAVTTPLEVLPAGGAITNSGTLRADGGRVLMTAKSAANVIDNVINTTGLVQAQSVALVNGEIVLDGGGAGTVMVNGKLDVSGTATGQTGGKAIVLGDTVVVGDSGRIDARGGSGGGEIYVGGGWQGASVLGDHASAIRTGVAAGAVLDASAITSGNGGTVVAWSDVHNPLSVTHAHGTFLANGGATGGNGGRIETSGHGLFTAGVRGAASAINGVGGQWLFDPYDVVVENANGYGGFSGDMQSQQWDPNGSGSSVDAATISGFLDNGTNVTITTTGAGQQTGTILVNAPITKTTGAAATLTLQADDSILVHSDIAQTGGSALNVAFNATNIVDISNDGQPIAINIGGSFTSASASASGVFTLGQGAVITATSASLTASEFNIQSDINAQFAISLTPFDPTSPIMITDGGFAAFGPTITLDSYTLSHLRASQRTIGSSDHTGQITVSLLDPNDPANADAFPSGAPAAIPFQTFTRILSAGAEGSIVFDGYYSLAAGDSLQLKAGSNITLGETLVATVNGKLDLISGGTFNNLAGGGALDTSNGGRWVIQAADLTDLTNTFGLYSSDYAHFNTTYSASATAISTAESNRYQFGNQPAVNVAPRSKIYGDSYSDELAQVKSDSLAFGAVDAAVYGDIFYQDTIGFSSDGRSSGANAQTYEDLTLNDVSALQSRGYAIGTTSGGIFTVTPRQLTVTLSAEQTKIYDGTDYINLTTGDFNYSGLVGEDQISIASVGTFKDGSNPAINAGYGYTLDTTLTAGNGGSYTFENGALASNYDVTVGVVSSNYATILRRDLTINAQADTRQYTGDSSSNVAPVVEAATATTGLVQMDTVTGLSQEFDGPAVGAHQISVTNYTINDGNGGQNYYVYTYDASGQITQKTLTASLTGTVTKTYNGNIAATLSSSNLVLSGLANGETATFIGGGNPNYSASFATKDVATGTLVTASFNENAFTGSANLNNYVLPVNASANVGVITAKALGATLSSANSKTYDGTTAATFSNGSVMVNTGVSGETITVNKTTGNFSNANAGSGKTVTTMLVSGDFSPGNGSTLLSNYVLPTTASYGYGTINPASLSGSLIGVSKVYNGNSTAVLAPANYQFTGFVAGDGVSISQTSGTYNSKNAGQRTVSATFSGGQITPTGSTNLSNYQFLGGNGYGGYTVSGAGTITPAMLTLNGISASNRQYDGTVSASVTGTAQLVGVVGADSVSLTGSGAGSQFLDANVGTGKTVTVSGYGLTGTDATNYTLNPASLSANITARLLSGAVVGTVSKVYDATTAATLLASNVSLGNFVSGEGANFTGGGATYNATYASANAGSGITVTAGFFASAFTPTGSTNLSNYMLPTITGNVGVISQRSVSAALTGTSTKVYDGSATASLAASNYVLNNAVNGDSVALNNPATGLFANPSAGSGKVVTVSGLALSGASANNYILSSTSTSGAIGTINQRAIGASLTGTIAKTYDGTNSATLGASNYIFGNLVSGDSVTLSALGGTYDTKNAGSSKTVTFTGLSLGGSAASNYVLAGSSVSGAVGTINQRTVTASLSGSISKDYDGNLGATIGASNYGLANVVSGDLVALNNPTTGLYDSAAAGSGKVVSTGGLVISGADAGNYLLANTSVSAAIGTINQRLLSAALTGTIQKTYDGSAAAVLGASYSLANVVNGETVTLSAASGAYDSKDAGTGKTVSFASLTLGGSTASNYTLGQTTTLSASKGTIDPRALSGALTGTVSKVYDGTTTATLGAGNVTLANFVAGEGAAFGSASGTYASANAGMGIGVSATVGTSALVANAGTNLANYTGPGALSGAVGTIGQRSVSAALTGTASKVYDGSTSATLSNSNYALANLVSGDAVTLNNPVSGTYDSANAGTGKVVSVGGLTIGGASASNYVLASTSTSGAIGIIGQRAVSAALAGTATKVYDGTTVATLGASNYALTNVVSGDSVALNNPVSGIYDSANAGTGRTVSVGGLALNGAAASNYVLASSSASGAIGTISQRTVGAQLTGTVAKTYDGTTVAALGSNGVLSNLVAGDTVTLSAGTGAYDNRNAGTGKTVTFASLALNGAAAANYTLGQTTSLSAAVGTIGQRMLVASLSGTATKVYDGTTTASLANAAIALANTVAGDTVSVAVPVAGTFADRNVGTAKTVTAANLALGGADAGNYTLASTSIGAAIGSITPANLIYLANAGTREQFVANPTFSGSVNGFVTGDTQATSTTGTLDFQTNATAASAPGSYQINGSGLSAQNYVFTQAPGNATALTVIAASAGTTTEVVQTVVRTAAVTAAVTPAAPPPPPPPPPVAPTTTQDQTAQTTTNTATNGATAGTPAAQPVSNQLPPPAPPADAPPPPPVEVANAVPPPAPVAPLPPSPVPETAPPTPTDTADANDAVLAEAGAPPPAQEPAGEQRQSDGSTTAIAPGVNVAVNTPPRTGETPGVESRFSSTGDSSQW